MEPDDDVVGEDSQRVLEGSASGQRQLEVVFELAFADERARAVSVEIRVHDAVERLRKLQINIHTT